MLVRCMEAEFRGLAVKERDKKKVYNANFEDCMSNPFSLYLGESYDAVRHLNKGDICNLLLDFNTRYNSIKLIEVE